MVYIRGVSSADRGFQAVSGRMGSSESRSHEHGPTSCHDLLSQYTLNGAQCETSPAFVAMFDFVSSLNCPTRTTISFKHAKGSRFVHSPSLNAKTLPLTDRAAEKAKMRIHPRKLTTLRLPAPLGYSGRR